MVEWAKLVVSVIVSSVAAYWAFFKWTHEREKDRRAREDQLDKDRQAREGQVDKERKEREKEREKERKRLAALYVNPFILACEELQSRLFNILERSGLAALKRRYPDGGYAEETLYLVAQYFAWERCLYRYTPYAQDPQVIRLTEKIRELFATDKLRVGAFCFYRPEQRNLGRLLQERAAGESGGEFDVISFRTFKEALASTEFLESSAVQQTLSVLKKTMSMEELDSKDPDVRTRLAKIQSRLVELLSYIESQEGITFFFSDDAGKRHTANEVSPGKRSEAKGRA